MDLWIRILESRISIEDILYSGDNSGFVSTGSETGSTFGIFDTSEM